MTTPNMQFLGSDGNPADNPDIPKSLRDNIYTGTEVKALDSGLTAETLKAQLAGELELPFHIDVVGFIEAAAERVFGFLMELGKTVIGGAVDFLSGAGKAIWEFGGAVFDAIGSGLRWAEDKIKRFLGIDSTPPPPPPTIISPILTDFEALVMPVAEKTKQTLEDIAIINAEILALEDEAARAISQSETATTNAQSAIDQLEAAKISLAADAKEALDRATASIAEAQAATQVATSTANALAKADTRLTNAAQDALLEATSALVVAEKGVADAKALNDRLPAIEADIATADDRINEVDLRLSNEVAGALSKAEQGIKDAKAASDKLPGINNEIATLGTDLGKVSGDLDASVQALSTLDTRLTKASGDAQAAADAARIEAEKVGIDLENLEIGGRNLARRRNLAGNSQYQTVVNTGEKFWTGEPIYYGEKITSGTPPTSLSSIIRIEPGETYTISMWIRGETDSGTTNANILFYDLGLNQSLGSTRTGHPASEWHLISGTVRNDTDAAYERVIPYFYINRNPGDKTWFTSPKLERGNKVTDWTPAPEDVEADIAAAQAQADQATLDAESKAEAARIAAEKYAKEKSEADAAQALVDATAEAVRVAKAEADAAKTAAAADAKAKADEAERLAKAHADAQATLAKEQAEANAALDATAKANKAKADAEANAKILSDKAQALAEEVKYTADTTAGKIPGMQDSITAAHSKAEAAQSTVDNLHIGGRNLLLGSAMPERHAAASGITTEMTPEGLKIVVDPVNENYVSFSRSVVGLSPAGDALQDGEIVTFSLEIKSEDSTGVPSFYAKSGMAYQQMDGEAGPKFTRVSATRSWVEANVWNLHLGFQGRPGTYIIRNFKLERGNKATDWTPAPEDVEADIAKAQAQADQAALDAASKAEAARIAAEKYAKEKSEAERAIAEENAAAEALRVAKAEAAAAKTAAAADAKAKADEAERLAKVYAAAQAKLAKEQAEANAAADAAEKANKAKADAEANAKVLSDKAQALAEQVKVTADTTAGAIPGMQDSITTAHAKAEAAKGYAEHVSYRGDNLVLNGFGELGDNTYFNSFTYIADDVPLGVAGSFQIGGGGAAFGERVPVDLTQELTVSCYLKKASDATQRVYFAVEPYDVDGLMIGPQHWSETAGTRAQLARPLKNGDTEIHLVDANSAAWAGSNMRGLIVWNYTDSRGKTWEPGTYSRHYKSGMYEPEGVNGNVITFTKPWDGADAEAGTWVSCGRAGGTYLYPFTRSIDHADWQYYEGVVGGSVTSGTSAGTGMPAATVAIRPRILLTPISGPVRVAGISMSYRKTAIQKAAAAQAQADQATLDAASKAEAARIAAENYAKEKSEADVAAAEVRAAAEAARVAKAEADAAKAAAATDAKAKADEAERLAKVYAAAQAKLAKEQAEATAAADATEKANKAKADAEANAKVLSDKAQSTADTAKGQADRANDLLKVQDTRNTDELPHYYWSNYRQTTVNEFKSATSLGLSGGYGTLTTVVPWTDSSGGSIQQTFVVNNGGATYKRRSNGSRETATWTAWVNEMENLNSQISTLSGKADDLTIELANAATQEDYNQLNTRLWGSQGELNKINSAMWNTQTGWNATQEKLNKATSDALAALNNYTKINNDLWGAQGEFNRIATEYQQHSTEIDDAQSVINELRAADWADQKKINAAKLTIDNAQNQAISANTRLLNMVFPAHSLVPPHVDGRIPGWEHSQLFLADGTPRPGVTRDTTDVPPGVTSAIKMVTTKSNTVAQYLNNMVAADPAIEYRYSFWAKAATTGTRIFIELRDQDGVHAIASAKRLPAPLDGTSPPYGGGAPYLANNLSLNSEWTKYEGIITLKPGTRAVRIASIYWSHSNGTAGTQWLADLQIYPNMPSQFEVDAAQTTAIAANVEATKALQTATRMAFPDISLVPTPGTNNKPAWPGSVAGSATNLPPGMAIRLLPGGQQDANTLSYSRTGTGTFAGLTGSTAFFSSDVYDADGRPVLTDMDLKLSFWAKVSAGSGTVSVRLKNESGSDIITHVKPIQLDDDGNFMGWAAGTVATTSPQLVSGTWMKYTYALRLKSNPGKLRIEVSTTADPTSAVVTVWGLHMSVYFPGQEEVDIAQNEATRALQDVANLRGQVDSLEREKEAIEAVAIEARGKAVEALSQSIPRHMMSVSGDGDQYDNFVRIPQISGSSWRVKVSALTTTSNWVGTILCRTNQADGRSRMERWKVPNADGTREYWTPGWDDEPVVGVDLTYFIDPMKQIMYPTTTDSVQRYVSYSTADSPAFGAATVLTVHTHTFERDAKEVYRKFTVGWDAATNGDYYGIRHVRIRNGVSTVMRSYRITKLGPVFPWENGYRTMSTSSWSEPNEALAGDIWQFEAWSSAGSSSQRLIRDSKVEMSWLEAE